MPTYYFKDETTGEETEEMIRISDLDEFKKSNPNLKQIIKHSNGITSGYVTVRQRAGSEWGNLLSKIKKGSGRGNTIHD